MMHGRSFIVVVDSVTDRHLTLAGAAAWVGYLFWVKPRASLITKEIEWNQ